MGLKVARGTGFMRHCWTVRYGIVFSALVGCSGGGPPPPREVPPPPVDAAPDAPPPPTVSGRGGSCDDAHACALGLTCLAAPGGYCGSTCGPRGDACDAACVSTARAGELCLAPCTRSDECRTDEGYVCDAAWGACVIPNMAAIVPARCPAAPGPARSAFAPSTQLSTSTSGLHQLAPTGVVTDRGNVIALFASRGRATAEDHIGLARSAGADGVTIDGTLPASEAGATAPSIARDRSGTLYAVWLAGSGELRRVRLATSRDDGATWSAARDVDDPEDCRGASATCPTTPTVVAGSGAVYVAYGVGDSLRVRASTNGGKSFGAPVTAARGNRASLTVGADGRLHVASVTGLPTSGPFGSADREVEYAVSTTGGRTFSRPVRVHRRGEMLPLLFATPALAVDTRRKWTYVAYVRGGRDAVWDLVIAASKDGGATWKRTRLGDVPACAIHMVPQLAVDTATGNLHASWFDSRGGGRLAGARCAAGGTKCVQIGAINDRPFATLATTLEGAATVGEVTALVIDDKRRRLHAVWTQPIDEAGTSVGRIFHAAMALGRK